MGNVLLKISRRRLTVTAQLITDRDPGEASAADALLNQATRNFEQMVERGLIEGWQTAPSAAAELAHAHALPVLIAVGFPFTPGLTAKPASFLARAQGIAMTIELPPGAPFCDPRLTLAIGEKLAAEAHYPPLSLEPVDIALALHAAATASDATEAVIRFRSKRLADVEAGPHFRIGLTSDCQVVVEVEQGVIREALEALAKNPHQIRTALLDETFGLDRRTVERVLRRIARELRQSSNLAAPPGMPIRVLAFTDATRRQATEDSSFKIVVSPGRMSCRIVADEARPVPTTSTLIVARLRAQGIAGIVSEAVQAAAEALTLGKAIDVEVARGEASTRPSKAYLARPPHPTSRQVTVDACVRPWEVAAVVSYETPGRGGFDVFGTPLLPLPPESDALIAGEGVIRTDAKFFSKVAGWVKIAGQTVSVEPVTSFTGNLTPARGGLCSSDSIVISGGVEARATIESAANVEIGHSFAGAHLQCKGDLVVKEGINAPAGSVLTVGGTVRVKFLHQGRIRCKGDVVIESNMTGGVIEAGGSVTVLDPAGGIFGGVVIAGGSITAANLGRRSGPGPTLWFGVKVTPIVRKRILEKRRRSLEDLAEALRRSGITRSPSGIERSLRAESRAKGRKAHDQISRLLETIDRRLTALDVEGDQQAVISVSGTIHAGVSLTSGNRSVDVREASNGVRVTLDRGAIKVESAAGSAKAST